jgi:hypothetical protein
MQWWVMVRSMSILQYIVPFFNPPQLGQCGRHSYGIDTAHCSANFIAFLNDVYQCLRWQIRSLLNM